MQKADVVPCAAGAECLEKGIPVFIGQLPFSAELWFWATGEAWHPRCYRWHVKRTVHCRVCGQHVWLRHVNGTPTWAGWRFLAGMDVVCPECEALPDRI